MKSVRLTRGTPPSDAFEAAPGLRNPHLQTVVGRIVRRRLEPRYNRVRLDTEDGDFIDLDAWPESGEPTGVCLLLHGLEGSAHSGYMASTSEALAAAGIQAVALNFRSCSGEPNRLPRAYHSGETGDIERALAWLSERFPGLPRAAVGFSLGGNALLNLLGRAGGDSGLAGAVVVSVPYDLAASAAALDRGPSRIYGRRFLRSLRAKAREKAARFPDAVPPGAASARTLREFDDLLTAPLHGFRDAADYYQRCSSGQFVASVTIPTYSSCTRGTTPSRPPLRYRWKRSGAGRICRFISRNAEDTSVSSTADWARVPEAGSNKRSPDTSLPRSPPQGAASNAGGSQVVL
ncbi:YheT family hydrolase [Candidatus Palauibacter sp.]|uniref:YheT family hydrolase n=1 Tax=Candidatus Palauibacter sp. TaxID=3101350 RepID=UPI003B01B875